MQPELAAAIDRLRGAGRITADDVRALRTLVYGAQAIASEAIEALAAMDGAAAERAPEWGDFFAEATTDYLVRQQDPPGYVDEAGADWLIRLLSASGGASLDTALEALSQIIEAADEAPQALADFARDKVKGAILQKGWIGAADTALLRRLIFAAAGDQGLAVSRAEAEMLFEIDEACRGGGADPGWPDFFARAVFDCLTAANPFAAMSRQQAERDEAFLHEPESPARFAHGVEKGFLHPDFAGAAREVMHPLTQTSEWAVVEGEIEAADARGRPVSDDEARWLLGRLNQTSPTEAERRLLGLLKAEASDVSGLLRPLLDAAPAPTAPSAGPTTAAPAFGHRRALPA